MNIFKDNLIKSRVMVRAVNTKKYLEDFFTKNNFLKKTKYHLMIGELIDFLVGKIKECHQNKLLYTSSGCASPFQPELDPNTQSQAIIANPISSTQHNARRNKEWFQCLCKS